MRKEALDISREAFARENARFVGAPLDGAAPARAQDYFAVNRLALTRFRSYQSLRLETSNGPVVLVGANGVGKTNLLEALSLLAPGRGLRRARLTELLKRGDYGANTEAPAYGSNWAVAATVSTPDGVVEIGTGGDPEAAAQPGESLYGRAAGDRRLVRIDGSAAKSQAALAKSLSVAWLTPEMDRLFTGPASARRRFLDRLVYGFVPDHAARVNAYERAMRDRARLLREGRADATWLAALENAMAENGVAVAAARRDVIARVDVANHMATSSFPRPAIAVSGSVETWLDTEPALGAEDRLRALLKDSRGTDAHTGGAADGPHRSDLRVTHVEKNMPADMCSTGEQKALLVALTLAVSRLQAVERGAPPLLLLDEIAAHLDDKRRAALFDELCALGGQSWMTGTDAVLFESLRGRAEFFSVGGGRVESLSKDG